MSYYELLGAALKSGASYSDLFSLGSKSSGQFSVGDLRYPTQSNIQVPVGQEFGPAGPDANYGGLSGFGGQNQSSQLSPMQVSAKRKEVENQKLAQSTPGLEVDLTSSSGEQTEPASAWDYIKAQVMKEGDYAQIPEAQQLSMPEIPSMPAPKDDTLAKLVSLMAIAKENKQVKPKEQSQLYYNQYLKSLMG